MSDELTTAESSNTVTPEPAKEFKSSAVPSPLKQSAPEPVVDHEDEDDDEHEDSATSDGADTAAKPRSKKGFKKRINELTRKNHESLRALEDSRKELEYWKSQVTSQQPKREETAKSTPSASSDRPKIEDFSDFQDYLDADYKWRRDSEAKENEEKGKRESREKILSTFREREQAFAADHPDYAEVAHAEHVNITPAMAEEMLQSELAPAIAYYLGQNPDEADDIAKLPQKAMERRLWAIEQKLSATPAKPAAPQKKTTNAPPPPKTVSSGGSATKSLDDMSTAERIAYWKSKGRKR